MTEEKDVQGLDDQGEAVKVEIHGEDDLSQTGAQESGSPEPGQESPEAGSQDRDPQTESADPKTDRQAGQDQDGEDGEDPGEDEGKNSRKGLFGFKNKKDKKDKKDEKIEQLTDQVTRQLAEFDNFRKRTDREKAAMFDMGKRDAIEKLLPVVDNFERGLGDMQEDEDPFRSGMIKIYRQLMTVLDGLGVKAIEAEGKPFDPNFHNAVMHCEDESVGENTIVQDLQKGYMMNDTVIRHSMVKVAN